KFYFCRLINNLMKKLTVIACCLISYSSLFAQPAKTVKTSKPVPKVVYAPKPLLKTLDDSASYAIGLSIGGFCKQQKITTPNTDLACRSFTDVIENKPTWMSESNSNDIINKLLMRGRVADSTLGAPVSGDSVSYAIGMNHAVFFKQQGITNLDTAHIVRALKDVLGNKP